MNMFTKLSGKGQVIVPAATRNRLGWEAGLDLEVLEDEDSVTFKRRRPGKSLTPDQAVAAFRQIYQHKGVAVTLEQMNEDARRMASGGDRFRA